MAKLFGRDGGERRRRGGTFPCARCGQVQPYESLRSRPSIRLLGLPVVPCGRRVDAMRCAECGVTYEPMVDGQLNFRQVADWNHRVTGLVAAVGIAAGRGRRLDHRAAAHTFLLRRGWFPAEADAVVTWATGLTDAAMDRVVDELVVALATLRSATRTGAMEVVVVELASALAVGGRLDEQAVAALVRCGDAAGVDRDRLAALLGIAGGTPVSAAA